MKITLVGAGMGGSGTLTRDAADAIAGADAVIGSERLLAGLSPVPAGGRPVVLALSRPEDVVAAVDGHPEWGAVCVLLSGDVGFYSGARRLARLLERHEPSLVPGVSAAQFLAARLRRPWHAFRLVSAHGTACDILAEALNHPEVLFLTGGAVTPRSIARTLCDAGLGTALVTVGENLSRPDERIESGSAEEVAEREFAPLNVVLVENGLGFRREARSPGIEDGDFVRGGAPMTKRETRAVALALLRPEADAVLYDVGAGTGSVAVEMALLARRGRVYAVEARPEACGLVEANKARFGVYNLRCVQGAAPDALAPLPPPSAAFIGGSGGRMREIVAALLTKNPSVRLAASAVTLETLAGATESMRDLGVRGVEVRQIAVSRTTPVGGLHMLEALNPVFLVSGGGVRE